MMKRATPRTALTLVETLMAVSLTSIVVAGMAAAMDGMLRQPALLRSLAEARRQVRLALRRMAAELESAQLIQSIIDGPTHQRIVFTVAADPAAPGAAQQALKIEWLKAAGTLSLGWADEFDSSGAPTAGRSIDLLSGCTALVLAYEGDVFESDAALASEFYTAAGIAPGPLDLSVRSVRVHSIAISIDVLHDGSYIRIRETVPCPQAPRLLQYSTSAP